jgi:2-polyprenyl-6-methoxyphenol hydroxylase-like FAD-dependent oxidoreductase
VNDNGSSNGNRTSDYDVVVVGGSLAGCSAAMLLGRAGQRVALVEKQPDPDAFKRICSHFIQASGVPTLERLGLLEPIMAAGGVRSRIRAWTPWGMIEAPPDQAGSAVNLRREVLDPLVRRAAAETDGVDMRLGHAVTGVVREAGAVTGVTMRDREGEETTLRAKLVVGADGRDSQVVKLAGVAEKTKPHGRFAYGGYFEGPPIEHWPDGKVWFMDPQWAAAFPTDSKLTFYAAMPTKDRLPEFKSDPGTALVRFLADLPDAPPILESKLVSDVLGKIDMTNRMRRQAGGGLALVGDAALAADPLFGVGCGWAFQSSEWMADAVLPALRGEEPLERGLSRYRKRHKRQLDSHVFFTNDYATGRPINPMERLLFKAAARDEKSAIVFDEFGTRKIGGARMLRKAVPRAIAVNVRHAMGRSAAAPAASPAAEVGAA